MKKLFLALLLSVSFALQAQNCRCDKDYDLFDSLLGQTKQELLDSLDKQAACFESELKQVRINYANGWIKVNYADKLLVNRLEWYNPPFTYEDIEHVFLGNLYLTNDKFVYKLHVIRDQEFHFFLSFEEVQYKH